MGDVEAQRQTFELLVSRRELELYLHRVVDTAAKYGLGLTDLSATARRRTVRIRGSVTATPPQIAQIGGNLRPASLVSVDSPDRVAKFVDLMLWELLVPGLHGAQRLMFRTGRKKRAKQARALLLRGQAFDESASYGAALIMYRTVVEQFGSPLGHALRQEISPFADQGNPTSPTAPRSTRGRKGRQVIADPADVELNQVIAWALTRMALTLDKCQRSLPAIAAYEEVIARYIDSEHAITRWRVGWAMYNKGLELERLERKEEAISAYDALVRRYAETEDPRVGIRVSWALWHQATLLRQTGRRDQAFALYQQVIDRYDEARERELAETAAWSMEYLREELQNTGRHEDAARIAKEMADRFAKGKSTTARELAERASAKTQPT